MRTLLMLGLLAAPLVAAADDQTSTREESREAAQAAKEDVKDAGQEAKEGAQAAGREARDDMHRAGTSADQREARAEHHDGQASADQKKQGPFADAHNFEVKGKLQKISKSSITIRRDEDKLPPAKLNVDGRTRIEVDGEKASWSKLQQGADVEASFNLRDDKPMAVEIKAEKTDAQKEREDRMKEQQKH